MNNSGFNPFASLHASMPYKSPFVLCSYNLGLCFSDEREKRMENNPVEICIGIWEKKKHTSNYSSLCKQYKNQTRLFAEVLVTFLSWIDLSNIFLVNVKKIIHTNKKKIDLLQTSWRGLFILITWNSGTNRFFEDHLICCFFFVFVFFLTYYQRKLLRLLKIYKVICIK